MYPPGFFPWPCCALFVNIVRAVNEAEARKTCWVAAINSVESARSLLPARLPDAGDGRLAELFDTLAGRHRELAGMDRQLKCPAWLPALLPLVAFFLGIAADALSASGRINLVAFPIFTVLGWNFAVYLILMVRALMPEPSDPGIRGLTGWLTERYEALVCPVDRRMDAKGENGPDWSAVRREFASYWFEQQRPLMVERVKANLHLAAVAAALGLIAGMYLRGLAFEYRAGWSSTFLDARSLETFLRWTLSPAAWVTGMELPDAAHLAGLSWSAGSKGENAADWIHLYAATCVLFIGLPRLLLALASVSRLARWRREFPLNLTAIGLAGAPGRPLEDAQDPKARHIRVTPFNFDLEPGDREIVRLFAFGEAGGPVNIEYREKVNCTDIEEYFQNFPNSGPEPFRTILLFKLAATPEDEVHGLAVRALQERVSRERLRVCVDGGSFVRRFREAADFEERLSQRRGNWMKFLLAYGVKPVFLRADT